MPVVVSGGSAEAEHTVPARPAGLDPQELGFTPKKPIGWLAPLLLLSTGLRALLAILFGAYLDKRELQNALDADFFDHSATADGELWLDYVADLGDGFDATYSIAWLLAQPQLTVDGAALPRGRLLLMGGDQVYPLASGDGYESRMKGPYRAALPEAPPGEPRPTLFALPGNHDWYDGLTAFLRLFARRKDGHIGGWRTEQRRSYFAVKLPGNWWLFAVDEQFGAYIDDPQLLYFEKAAREVGPDDRIILMAPSPTWVKAKDNPEAYDAVDYFIRTIVAPTRAQVRVLVSGDLHHYARYTGEDRELITCGGGGAYLLGTHKLPPKLVVPPRETMTRSRSRSREYELVSRFPDPSTSRKLGWGVFHRIQRRNAGFATMLGIIHTLTMLPMAGAARQGGSIQRLFSIPLLLMLVLILAGTVLFAKPPGASSAKHARHWILGVSHGLAQIALAAGGTWVWLRLPFQEWAWPGPFVVAAILYGPAIAILSTQLVALYLLVASTFDVNLNELYAGQGIEDAKSFLRMHIAADGTLTIHPLGVDQVCHQWAADPEGEVHTPWLRPEQPLAVHRIEPPIAVAGPGTSRP
ncbi:metallophosphoesterase [Actinoplanes awajinensis]|uniref:Metallophosphoesterase n=1 Tax=Actinoplanes awajinensis subsp. mycoplanecinus TaxID=135947 RepID=A0A117MRW1_9ACTN|nr:metallophosphoesterase [Actinoplanes awajinensis]KUL32410.1 metallophosphoesterase [Actinoplanes awajinensis subsp. mycoplanecinus]